MPCRDVMGYVFIVTGYLMILITVITYWGFWTYKGRKSADFVKKDVFADILKELIKKLPWVTIVGLLLIYFGMKTFNIVFP